MYSLNIKDSEGNQRQEIGFILNSIGHAVRAVESRLDSALATLTEEGCRSFAAGSHEESKVERELFNGLSTEEQGQLQEMLWHFLRNTGQGGVENLLRISFSGEWKKLFLGELRKSY